MACGELGLVELKQLDAIQTLPYALAWLLIHYYDFDHEQQLLEASMANLSQPHFASSPHDVVHTLKSPFDVRESLFLIAYSQSYLEVWAQSNPLPVPNLNDIQVEKPIQ